MGPGARYLETRCPSAGFLLCAARDKLPLEWTEILFCQTETCGVFGSADLATKQAMGQDQFRFALAVFSEYPTAVSVGLAGEFLRQLTMIGVSDAHYAPDALQAFATRLPAAEFTRVINSRAAISSGTADYYTAVSYLFTGISILAIPPLLMSVSRQNISNSSRSRRTSVEKIKMALALLFSGYVANAAICEIIAHPYDRFQSRIAWIVPLGFIVVSLISAAIFVRNKGGRV